nr:TetR/AcrR family transcriptional regulator [Flavobacterium sp. ASV13]
MKDLNVHDRIVETATRLFYTKGYNMTGINQIIDEASIAKASLYAHYRSKSELLTAYLDGQANYFFNELEKHLEGIKGTQQKLTGIFDFHVAMYEMTAFGGCPFLRIKAEVNCTEAEVWGRVEQNKNRLKEIFNSLVADIDNKTGLSNDALADLLYYLLEGATVTATIKKNTDPIKSALKSVKTILNP